MQKITRQLLLIESIGDLPKIELDIKHLLQAKNLTILENFAHEEQYKAVYQIGASIVASKVSGTLAKSWFKSPKYLI